MTKEAGAARYSDEAAGVRGDTSTQARCSRQLDVTVSAPGAPMIRRNTPSLNGGQIASDTIERTERPCGAPQKEGLLSIRARRYFMRFTRFSILLFGVCVCSVTPAQTPNVRAKANVAAGKGLFREHCAACHGADGKGGGSMYDPLSADPSRRIPPADLTQLAQKYAEFPTARVQDSIHSKGSIAAHGTPNMPAWGDIFYNQKSNPKLVERRVRDLTAYIESIQEGKK